MTVSEKLKKTWAAVSSEAGSAKGDYQRRIPLACPWPAHAGVHAPTGALILVLESESTAVKSPSLKDKTKGYSIDIGTDESSHNNRALIRISETSPDYREIFAVFCADILDHWCAHSGASECIKALRARLARWKKFFMRGGSLALSREAYIGLYGELCFIDECLTKGISAFDIFEAWQGPLGANQDFLFGPLAIEAKATTSNEPDKVRITNARQLDTTGLKNLFLIRYSFDFRLGSGRKLPELVESIKIRLSAISSESLSTFNNRLFEAGFVGPSMSDFDGFGFSPRHFDVFEVSNNFPRLLEASAPPGVSEISYTLNLSAAGDCKIAPQKFWIFLPKSDD